jgi:acetyl esterase
MNQEVTDYLESLRAAQEAAGPMETLPELREWYRDVIGSMPQSETLAGFAVEQRHYPSGGFEMPLLIQRPGEGIRPALVYFHGGGFALGDASATAETTALLASVSGCVVVSGDYRLAPEHPYPAAHDDAVAALRWVQDHAAELGVDGGRIAVAGDSSGAALALHAALEAHAAGSDVSALVLFYGWFIFGLDSESMVRLGPTDPVLPTPLMEMFRSAYFGTDAEAAAKAQKTELPRLPDTCIIFGDSDPLASDSETVAELLKEAGTQVEVHRFGGMPHGFSTIPVLTDGRRSVELAGSFLATRTSQSVAQ